MTNPFVNYAFLATGASTPRKLPDRLAEIKNVRDFGAMGDGITDDLDAIMSAMNWITGNTYRGTVYFPPGTYYVRAPIDFSAPDDFNTGPFVHFLGEMGLSTVIGNFSDYVFKRGINSTPRWSGGHFIEKLTIINSHAGGGGIRLGAAQACAIRDCDVTADISLNDDNTDIFIDGGAPNGSFETYIENCNCRPYNTLATGTIGLYKVSDGPVVNCRFVGFDLGMGTAGGEGASTVHGCYFEGNNVGFSIARGVEAWAGGGGSLTMSGCHFKNNGVSMDKGGGNCNYLGIRIEAVTGSIPGNPQYGIRITSNQIGTTVFRGVSVTGDYQQAGIYLEGTESTTRRGGFVGVSCVNSAGPNWLLPMNANTAFFKSCNVAPVFTVARLPAYTLTITTTSWSSGTATVNFTTSLDLSNLVTKDAFMTITGVSPSGYNGTFTGTVTSFAQVQFPLVSNPGGSGSGGTIFFTAGRAGFDHNAWEGDTYNVSDANTSTWGSAVTNGGGANHVKLRFTPSAWTVMGK